ncbi:MAG: RNA polymerase sigma-70 factor [Prevotellaceae bacterium]|jgi:RNA polymerase sigma-70 factor (ECF subfamily)|nr:RNA polymerase sigma-70 factor [Prevotellaceae bacterium]
MPHPKHTHDKDADEQLLCLLRQGSKEAFTSVYERYHKMLYALSYRYLKNQAAAEDAVQHVFVKLWEHRADIAVEVSLRNYLYSMTKNHILNYIRNEHSALTHNYRMAQKVGNVEDNLLETIEKKELMAAFYQAIEQLSARKKEICLLKMEDKLSNQEIADRMSLSVNTVKSHYAQAVKLLRMAMSKMFQWIAGLLIPFLF